MFDWEIFKAVWDTGQELSAEVIWGPFHEATSIIRDRSTGKGGTGDKWVGFEFHKDSVSRSDGIDRRQVYM